MTSHSSSRALGRRRNRDFSGDECSRDRAQAPREGQAPNIYDQVTARIIAELEAGRLPWVQPWAKAGEGAGCGPALPRNALTGRNYSGINILLLWGEVIAKGYPSQNWLTFRQALEAGGNVRKGEHGTCVVYADRFIPEAEKARARESGGEARAVPFLKRFTVFNIAQCEGLEGRTAADPVPLPEREIVPVAEAVIAASGVDFRVGGDKAYYMPSLDVVQVPPQPAFFEQINYYRTCLHELTHATGHAKRLNRDLTNGFGSKDYAREELPRWVQPSSAHRWGSSPPCAMPIISAHGWRCCARTARPFSAPRARPVLPLTGCWNGIAPPAAPLTNRQAGWRQAKPPRYRGGRHDPPSR